MGTTFRSLSTGASGGEWEACNIFTHTYLNKTSIFLLQLDQWYSTSNTNSQQILAQAVECVVTLLASHSNNDLSHKLCNCCIPHSHVS
mmetsp:Transcript_8264/g.11145  ORF Transcript_8264/g.11145 Transcript_8264/m.11145 type:complete len:88 (-) Transcript_8264:1023-1286(-)